MRVLVHAEVSSAAEHGLILDIIYRKCIGTRFTGSGDTFTLTLLDTGAFKRALFILSLNL